MPSSKAQIGFMLCRFSYLAESNKIWHMKPDYFHRDKVRQFLAKIVNKLCLICFPRYLPSVKATGQSLLFIALLSSSSFVALP
jgi:hypothetical protein